MAVRAEALNFMNDASARLANSQGMPANDTHLVYNIHTSYDTHLTQVNAIAPSVSKSPLMHLGHFHRRVHLP